MFALWSFIEFKKLSNGQRLIMGNYSSLAKKKQLSLASEIPSMKFKNFFYTFCRVAQNFTIQRWMNDRNEISTWPLHLFQTWNYLIIYVC